MTTTRQPEVDSVAPHRPARRVLKWAGVGLAVALVAGGTYWALARSGVVPAPPAVTVSTPTPVATPAGVPTFTDSLPIAARPASGCLGGPDARTAVLAAQQSAALDSVGAAEFALAVQRFAGTDPFNPDSADIVRAISVDPDPVIAGMAAMNEQDQATGETGVIGFPVRYRVVNNTGTDALVQVVYTRRRIAADGAVTETTRVFDQYLTAVGGQWMITPNTASTLENNGDPTYTKGFQDYSDVGCGNDIACPGPRRDR